MTPPQAAEARWPNPWAVLACFAVGAVVVALDAWFSAQVGYLSRAPDYDGVSYLGTSRAVAHLLLSHHFRTALSELNSSLAPLWIAALALEHDLTLITRDRHFRNIPQLPRA